MNLAETNAAPILYQLSDTPSNNDWADFCGVARETIWRWRQEGITEYEADRIATVCVGLHPSLIWPDWFDGVGW